MAVRTAKTGREQDRQEKEKYDYYYMVGDDEDNVTITSALLA